MNREQISAAIAHGYDDIPNLPENPDSLEGFKQEQIQEEEE